MFHLYCGRQVIRAYKILVVKPEQYKPIGRWRHGWDHNIKTVLKENGCVSVNWIHVAQDERQIKGSYEHDDERLAAIDVEKFLDLLSDYQIIKTDSAP
jgi:hypothetical protein